MSENDSIGEPVWKHDCDKCVFLGQYDGDEGDQAALGLRDLYFHREDKDKVWCQNEIVGLEDVGFWSVLVRWSNGEGEFGWATTADPDYPLSYKEMTEDYRIAIDTAIAKGYLLPSEVEGHPEVGGDI